MSASPTARWPLPARDVLLLGAWFGLFTGLGAVALWAIKAFVLDRITLITPHIVWAAPVTFLVLGLLAGTVLVAAARVLPRLVQLHTVVFALALAGCACGLLTWETELHHLAVGILSLGIAVQLAAFARRRPDTTLRLARRTLSVLVASVGAMTVALVVGPPAVEAWSLAHLPAARAGAPNVLLIILDTVRAANLSLYGYARPTSPFLDRFAAQSTTFDNALSAAPWTLPSHSSMFTGRPPHELSADWEEALDDTTPTLAEHLRAHGYRTGGFAGNYFYCNSEFGLARGFVHYEDYIASPGQALPSTFPGHWLVRRLEDTRLRNEFWFQRAIGRRTAPSVRASLVRWLGGGERTRPWFAFANFMDAHDPYVAPEPFIRRMAALPRVGAPPVRRWDHAHLVDATPEGRRAALASIDRYDAGIAYLDEQIGMLLADLEARHLLENTIVIIAADHGEEFGEGGRYWHGETVRLTTLHVPLMIRAPGLVSAGTRVREPVSLRDLAATIADLTGTRGDFRLPGASLARTWNGGTGEERPAPILSSLRLRTPRSPSGESSFFSLYDAGAHYVRSDCGREQLYATRDDPFEQRDLANQSAARLGEYRTTLRRLLGRDDRSKGCAPR